MKEQTFQQMTDLLPLPPVAQGTDWPLIMLTAGVAVLLLFAWWRWYHTPWRRLERKLKTHAVTTRQAAHELAALSLLAPDRQQALDRLRFARCEPRAEDVLALLWSIRDGS